MAKAELTDRMRGLAFPERTQAHVQLIPSLLATLALILMSGVVPLLIVGGTPNALPDAPWPWAVVVLVWAGAHLAWAFGTGRPSLYSVTCWVFVYVFLGLAPFLQMRLGTVPDTTPGIEVAHYDKAMAIVLVGLASLDLTRCFAPMRPAASERPSRLLDRRRVIIFTFGTLAFVGYALSRTGFGPYFQSRDALSLARANAWPDPALAALAFGASVMFPLVAFHALVLLRRQLKAAGERSRLLVLTVVLGVVVLVTINIISSSRIIFGTALLSLAILAGAISTPVRARATIGAILVGMIVVFPSADLFRHDAGAPVALDLNKLAISGDYDAFAQITNAVTFVEKNGLTDGRQALGVVLFWVPRSSWPDKPIDTGILLAKGRGYNFTNLSAPLWAEAYVNGGWLALIVTMGGLGLLLRRGDEGLKWAVKSGGIGAAAGALLPFYLIIILRGSLLAATATLLTLAVPLWFVSTRPQTASRVRWDSKLSRRRAVDEVGREQPR